MRQSQLPVLGLLLAVFLGSRFNLPSGQSVGGSADVAGKAHSSSQIARTPARASKPASKDAAASTKGQVNCDTAALKTGAPSASGSPRAAACVPAQSQAAQTFCRLNARYNQKQAMKDGFASQASAGAQPVFPDCLPSASDSQPVHILSVMATVEDPIHTHLGLGTDRTIDTIQAAAAAALYNPYSHFLPWRPSDATGNAEENTDGEADLHEPGLLILRKDVPPSKPAEYLAVFLIPELPTTGLDQEAFFLAQKIMAETAARTGYPADSSVIRLAGPNFSGSMASFADIDGVLHSPINSGQQYSIYAVSGSITSPPSYASENNDGTFTLTHIPACTEGASGRLRSSKCRNSTLSLTQTSDCEAINALLRGVQLYGISSDQIAVVSEEGTEFGNRVGPDGQNQEGENQKDAMPSCQIVGPLFLHFPREISKLRNAYGAQAGQTTQTTPATQPGLPQADMPINWQDSEASRGDDVPAYGAQQTPLSQQAALSSLAGILRRQNIKLLGILATDPMDEAFLIRSFKKSSRDVRLFLRDPDLVYLRTLDTGSLNGTLLVNNYPLITQNQFWSSPDRNSLVTFPSALQEAQYNAFLAVLENLDPQLPPLDRLEGNWPAGTRLTDARRVASFRPPLWLAVMGTAGDLPLTILPPPQADLPSPHAAASKLALSSLNVGFPHYMTMVFWAVVAMLGLFHILGLSFPGRLPKLLTYDFHVIASTKAITASKALCHTAALSVLTLMQLMLGSSFMFFGDADLTNHWLYKSLERGVILTTAVFVLAVFSLLVAVAVFYWNNRADIRSEDGLPLRPLFGLVFAVTIFGIIGTLWASQVFPATFNNAFLHVRDLNLVGGVAPCLPITLMLLIVYLGCWAYLRRLTYWDYRKPKLPALALDDILPSDFNSKGGKMKGIDRCLLESLENHGWVFILILTCSLGFVAFRPWITLDMIELFPIPAIVLGVFVLAFLVLQLNWFRFVNIWSLLRDILEDLERLPIQAAFQRMPVEKSMPIWRWGVSDNSFLPPAQAVEGFRELVRQDHSLIDPLRVADLQTKIAMLGRVKDMEMENICVWTSLAASWSNAQPEILEMPRAVNAGPAMFAGFKARKQPTVVSSAPNTLIDLVQETGEDVADLVGDLIVFLRPEYWRHRSNGSGAAEPQQPVPPKFILAEDLVALRYYSYIRYVVDELRNLLLFVAIAFSLLFLAFHTYAFRAEEAIDGAFLLLFVVLGGGIFLVLYQMEVDPILSHFGGGKSGEVGWTFYLDLLKYGAVPCLTIIGSHVPIVSNFLLRWLQPTLESMH